MKIIVGCDADGILTDLSEHNIREGKKVFKKEAINPEAYSLEEMFDVKNIPKIILYAKAFKIYVNYCKNEKPRENASRVIKELSQNDFEFNSITARKFATSNSKLGDMARKWFKDWLKKNDINFKSLQFCSEERSPEDKLLACKKLNVNYMIEDKPEVALYLAKNGIKVIMIDAPYNLDVKHENITHVSDWNQIKDILLKAKEVSSIESEFIKKEKEDIQSMTLEEKKEYFNAYKNYLKNISVNQEAFKSGDKKFKLIFSLLKYPVKAFYHLKVFGKEKIPYQNGFIIASNHNDSTDQYRIGLALGNRPFVGYAAKEIEDSFRGKLFKSTGLGIFVDRSDAQSKKESADLMSRYVAHDRIALIFPEGTRKNKDEAGKNRFQNRFKIGTVALAQKTGTGILPVATNAFGNDTVIQFGDMMYIEPTDNLEVKNRELELIIAKMSYENIKYYLEQKGRLDELTLETIKYNNYLEEVKNSEYEENSKKI